MKILAQPLNQGPTWNIISLSFSNAKITMKYALEYGMMFTSPSVFQEQDTQDSMTTRGR